MPRVAPVLAFSLLLATPALALEGRPAAPLDAPLPRQNVRVNDPTMDSLGRTNSGSSVAVRGSRVVVGFNDASRDTSAYAFSTDGGGSFTHRRLAPPPEGRTLGEPVVAYGLGNDVYYGTLMVLGDGVSTVGLAKSTDGGATFGTLTDVALAVEGPYEQQDKEWIAVDATPGSRFAGNVYASWTYFGANGESVILFARSTDGGATFLDPLILSPIDTAGVQSSTIAVAPNGDVYVAFEDGHASPEGISIRKSADGGVTFGGTKTIATFNPLTALTGGGGVRASSYPSLAVDASNRVHLVFAAVASGATTDRADVFYVRSSDGGVTYTTARKLNDDGTSTSQAFPAVAVASDGSVVAKWVDRRNDPANDGLSDVYVAISRDSGTTFGKSIRVTDTSWVYGPVEPSSGEGYHGDYDGLAVDGGNVYVTWSDERGADPDVYFAALPISFDPATPDFVLTSQKTYGSVRAGQAASFDLPTSGVNGFAGSLTLSASPVVPGLSYAFSTGAVSAGQTARLTVTASAAATAGDVHLTVSATGGGMTRSTTIWLTVYGATRPVDTPVNVTSTAGFTGGTVKVDPSGRLHVAYEDDSAAVLGQDVFYRRSTDGGATFSTPVKLNAAGSTGFQAAVATDAGDRVFVVWSGGVAGQNERAYVARSTDAGVTFAAPVAVSPDNQRAFYPNVAVDRSGNVLVAYYDVVQGYAVLGTTRSTNGGAIFDAPKAISDGAPSTTTRPGIAFDSKGAAYVTYTRQVVVGAGFLLSSARIAIAKDGRSFGTPYDLTLATNIQAFAPDVTVGADDAIHVVYYQRLEDELGNANREVVAVRSTDAGATYTPPLVLSGNAGQSYFPAVIAEPGGGIDVAWEDDSQGGGTDVLYARSTDGGRTFTAPANLSANLGLSGSAANPLDTLGGSGRVALSVTTAGTVAVSWLDDSPANPDLFVTTVKPGAIVTNNPPVATITVPAGNVTIEAGQEANLAGTGTDPDGDALTYSWVFGDGATSNLEAPGAHLYSRPGVFTVTFTVRDARGASASASVTVTVVAPTATGTSFLLPVVLEAAGVGGSRYTSEVTLASRATDTTEVILSYTASEGGGSGVARLALAPGSQLVVPALFDLLRSRNLPIPADGGTHVGTLLVTFARVTSPATVFAGARTYTPDPAGGAGTFGLFYAGASTTTSRATLFGLRQDSDQRSNVAVVNAGPDPITLRVALQGPNGQDLGTLPDIALSPYGWAQVAQPLAGKAVSGRAVVTRVAGAGAFTAYAVLNDAVTSDGSFLPPILDDDGSGADRIVPIVLDAQGLGARFRTELTLTNFTSAALALTLGYRAADGLGGGTGPVSLTLAPQEQRVVPDAIAFLRATLPIEADGRSVGGTLLVTAPAGTPASALAVGARTFVPASPAGSYGLFYPGLTLAECATSAVTVYGLQEGGPERSNLALVNRGDAGDPITLRVTLHGHDGTVLGPPIERVLPPGGWIQLGRPLDGTGATSGYATVERIGGASRFVAYGVRNDNVSGDGSYVPMSR